MKKPLNVWLIEDEKDLGEVFVETFESQSINITHFINPLEAIKKLETETPDLVFVDYRMPQMKGDKVIDSIPKNIDCYLVTGEIEIGEEIKNKFKGFLFKPFKSNEIGSILKTHLDNFKKDIAS